MGTQVTESRLDIYITNSYLHTPSHPRLISIHNVFHRADLHCYQARWRPAWPDWPHPVSASRTVASSLSPSSSPLPARSTSRSTTRTSLASPSSLAPSAPWSGRAVTPSRLAALSSAPPTPSPPPLAPSVVTSPSMSAATSATAPTLSRTPRRRLLSGSRRARPSATRLPSSTGSTRRLKRLVSVDFRNGLAGHR